MSTSKQPNTKLLTGIPRSGTTLCCKLLNQCGNTLALHEPINPQKLTSVTPVTAASEIKSQIQQIRHSLMSNQAIEHGDKAGVDLDNPIGLGTNETGLRLQKATRGLVTLPTIDNTTGLYIKQNALFAALAEPLTANFDMFAIIRNPVDVLLSWMTVDLPVNKGRLPAGEKFDKRLAELLRKVPSVIERQITIYSWFVSRYQSADLTTIRYEDIIQSQGQALYGPLGLNNTTELSIPQRTFSREVLQSITSQLMRIKVIGNQAGYDDEFMMERVESLSL
ncbi:hypothetical protein [Alteromonas gracilis]|uniref:hypothetical protein n=1 Tax=Alteromonas gracilis TaxID=1479524 RepID=UPI0030D5C4B5